MVTGVGTPRSRSVAFLFACILCAGGCATLAPRPERMAAVPVDGAQAFAAPPLAGAVTTGAVIGAEDYVVGGGRLSVKGEEMRGAVRLSLQRAGYLAPDHDRARFILDVAVIWLEPPTQLPLDLTGTATTLTRYRLSRREDGTIVFDDLIAMPCTMSGVDAFRRAVECAVGHNIGALLHALREATGPARRP